MKVAIPHWQGRVSPVFDVAGNVLVVEIDGGSERARQEVVFNVDGPQARAARLTEAGADVLVCGAISKPLEVAVSAAGIEVIPQTCGEVGSVLRAASAFPRRSRRPHAVLAEWTERRWRQCPEVTERVRPVEAGVDAARWAGLSRPVRAASAYARAAGTRCRTCRASPAIGRLAPSAERR